ncbi:MAG: bifunctional DNA primase/polymerase, partial [Planctomycetes bacterium]|nr:bifunctional DNA primase/polymerase [Planctomycetota bacterium]
MMVAACWYASHGLPVFPLKPRAKEPLTPHGFKDATTDQVRIAAWWQEWPDANIGIPTGTATGLLAVDVDPRNGGDDSLEQLLLKHGRLPDTAEQMTGARGRHILFRHPGFPVPKALAPGIDLKGDGGYIVVAPSVHPNGNSYRWDGIAGAKALLNPAPAPSWLVELIQAQHNGARAVPAADGKEKWATGERNNCLTSLAGTMRWRGMAREAIEAALLAENRRRCDPPLSETEVCGIAESVASYKPAEERNQPARGDDATRSNWPDELKPEAFHGVAGEVIRAIEPHSEADPAALLIQFLVGFGNVI